MTPQQAITLYNAIEALMNQFDRENDPAGKGECAYCGAPNVVAYRCTKCGYLGSPKNKNTCAAMPNDGADLPRISGVSQPQALPIKRQRE